MSGARSAVEHAVVGGADLAYEVSGSGEPLVLIHRGLADRRMWDVQVAALSAAFRTISYDLRGFGESTMPPGPYAHHDDLRGLLEHLGITKAHLVGSSMGGGVALDFALAHPEMVASAVLVGSGVSGHRPSAPMLRSWAEIELLYRSAGLEAAVELALGKWVDGPAWGGARVDAGVRDCMRVMFRHNFPLQAGHNGTLRQLMPPAISRLHEFRAPALILVGEHDRPEIRDLARLLAARLPDARLQVIAGAGHMVNLEQPETFSLLVRAFASSVHERVAP